MRAAGEPRRSPPVRSRLWRRLASRRLRAGGTRCGADLRSSSAHRRRSYGCGRCRAGSHRRARAIGRRVARPRQFAPHDGAPQPTRGSCRGDQRRSSGAVRPRATRGAPTRSQCRADCDPTWRSTTIRDLGASQSELRRPRPPFVTQPRDRHVVVLAPSGLERRDLRRAGAAPAALAHLLDDLGPTAREVLADLGVDPGDLGDSLINRRPLQAEPLGELSPQRRLVQEARGLGVREQRPAIEGRLAPLGRGPIRDDSVGVQLRIARRELRWRNSATVSPSPRMNADAVAAPAGPARLTLDVAERVENRRVMRASRTARDSWSSPTPIEDRNGLGGRERQVVGKDRPVAVTCARVEHLQERVVLDTTRQSACLGAPAGPPSRSLTGTGVVVLAAGRDRVEVVAGIAIARADLSDGEHQAISRSARRSPPGHSNECKGVPPCDGWRHLTVMSMRLVRRGRCGGRGRGAC